MLMFYRLPVTRSVCRFLFLVLFIVLCSKVSTAQSRFITRKVVVANDGGCTFSTKNSWSQRFEFPSKLKYPSTIKVGEYADYAISNMAGMEGEVEIMVYKNWADDKLLKTIDAKAVLIISHSNKLDTVKNVSFSTPKTGWYSLGKFTFNGDVSEFVRVQRINAVELERTIAPTLRFDFYFDTKPRTLSATENKLSIPLGFSSSKQWESSEQKGYLINSFAKKTTSIGASCVWNPGMYVKGKMGVYVFNPNVKANDKYEIVHDGKVEEVALKYMQFANANIYNPIVEQGWYKLGEFDFKGDGKEYVRLIKTNTEPSIADCIFFESTLFDGTIVNRIVVSNQSFSGTANPSKAIVSIEEKEENTTVMPGFSPIYKDDEVPTSSKNGMTCYGRPYYIKNTKVPYYWNPLITDSGKYSVYYYAYWTVKGDGSFSIVHDGKTDKVNVAKTDVFKGGLTKLGDFYFAGNQKDEYLIMEGNLDRASDMVFEKKVAGGAILQQRIITGHPYFKELVYEDAKDMQQQHAISYMVQKGFVAPKDKHHFAPKETITVEEFTNSVTAILQSDSFFVPKYSLLFGLPAENTNPNKPITNAIALQILNNAMEYTGKYLNVINMFSQLNPTLQVPDYCKEAANRMMLLGVIKSSDLKAENIGNSLSRAEVSSILKEFYEQVLHSGPPANADWEMTFDDEFNGVNIDYSKWRVSNQVRFKGLSAKWAENSLVEDGVYKGYNYFDNHAVPYSSGEIVTNFTQQNGFFEARYKYPDRAYGSHTSFWTSAINGVGDFNYNEGTYPNGVSNNNYFMKKPENFNNFKIKTNFAHDFHTISAYLDPKDLFYGIDGKVSYEVKDYPRLYNGPKNTTQVPYGFWLSTIVTYFDGPLDRDRIDGTYMSADWVRIYKKTNWKLEVDKAACFPIDKSSRVAIDSKPIVKFNKPFNMETIKNNCFEIIEGKNNKVVDFSVQIISSERLQLVFSKPLKPSTFYKIVIKKEVKDRGGEELNREETITFKTK